MRIRSIFYAAICIIAANFKAFAFFQPLENSNYVVIGAFAIEEHATQFVESARKMNFKPVSEINPNRHLFYVYVLQTQDRKAAFVEASRIRKSTPYFDTWVYTGSLGSNGEIVTKGATEVVQQPVSTLTVSNSTSQLTSTSQTSDQNSVQATSEAKPNTPQPIAEAEEGSKNFLFKIFTTIDRKEVQGDVDLIDIEKTRRVASYAGNQSVSVQRVNESGKVAFVCDVFGYQKQQTDLNFEHPEETVGVTIEENQTIVPFELKRLQKGDVAVMYNVYFYKDAAIMRPESKYEVNSLLEMMKENPKYRIKIHGHTNGNAAGKIISMGESKKFFQLTDTREGFGTAKKLSESRAEVIREYLMAEGIDQKRMEIKAWGGKRPVHDKFSEKAGANVRVEIEILADK